MNNDFLITKEYRRFEEFCAACRRDKYIGICFGPPGVGKTLSSRHYSLWDSVGPINPFSGKPEYPAAIADRKTLFYTAPVSNSPRKIEDDLNHGLFKLRAAMCFAAESNGQEVNHDEDCELIIVDEAERLSLPSLEHLRDRYDREGFGLIVIGMPGIEKKLSRYPQLYSRVGFAHAYKPVSEEEMEFVLKHHWEKLGLSLSPNDFTDQEAMASVIRITAGNFRLVSRLFSQIQRIMKVNALSSITREVVESARQCLVVGVN